MGIPTRNPIKDILTSKEPLVEWLVEGFIPQGMLLSYAGEPGVGKSVFCFHMAIAVACGLPPLGGLFPACPAGPVSVLYFDQENSKPDHNQYLKWAWEGLNKPDIRTLQRYLWVPHFELGGKDWADNAAEWIERIQPNLIFYDTATPCFNTRDENDNAEATDTINTLRELANLTEKPAAQVVLKHSKIKLEKEGRRTLRGAKAWEGATDGIIFHTKSAGRPRSDGLSMTRLEPKKTRAFGLRKVVNIDPGWTANKAGLFLKGKFVEPGKPVKREKVEYVEDSDDESERLDANTE